MKNRFNLMVFAFAISITSIAHSIESKMQILTCGTVKISTNSADPGKIGAPVVTTFVEVGMHTFKLIVKNGDQSTFVSNLTDGQMVTVFGVFKTHIDSNLSEKIVTNLDGSIDLDLHFGTNGCVDSK